jgi:hypothetical protein
MGTPSVGGGLKTNNTLPPNDTTKIVIISDTAKRGVTFLLVWCSVVSSKRHTHYGIPQYQLVVTR